MAGLDALVRFIDYSDPAWTEAGGITIATDTACSGGEIATGDGVNDTANIVETGRILTSATYSVSCIGTLSDSGVMFAQTRNSTTSTNDRGTFHLSLAGGGGTLVSRCMNFNDANAVVSQSTGTFQDSVEYHFMLVLRAFDSLDLYVDGVEVTYSTHNSVSGTGANGINTSGVKYSVHDFEDGSTAHDFLTGTIRRPTVFNRALSPAEVLTDFQNEHICQVFGPPVGTGTLLGTGI